jgi:membrane protein
LYNKTDEDHCFLFSAGIAFNVLYSIVPLSLVIFYVFSASLTSDKAISSVVGYITESFPVPVYSDDLRVWLTAEIPKAGHAGIIAGIVGGITLFWLASTLFSTLRTSINAVFGMSTKRSVIYQKLLDFLLMIAVLVLLLVTTFLSPVVSVLQHLGTEVLPGWLSFVLDTTIPRLVSLVVSIVLYLLLFYLLPHESLSRKVLVVSAATTVVLTETMRLLFTYYMKHLSSIGTLYGAYAFLIGISLWVYYASFALLIGAEIGKLYKERNEPATGEPNEHHRIYRHS